MNMSKDLIILITMLIINLLIVVVYTVWQILRRKEGKLAVIVKVLVMLLCPIIGAVFILIGYLAYKIFSHAVDLEDVIFNKQRGKVYMHADEERGRNMVPVEEALVVTDKINLRKLMMNVVRGDVKKSLSSIALALDGEDSETSHYAASVLQEALGEFRTKVGAGYRTLNNVCKDIEEGQDVEFPAKDAVELIQFMNEYLVQKVFTSMEQHSTVLMMEEVANMVCKYKPEELSAAEIEAVCLRLLEIKEYEKCAVWCQLGQERYPDVLSSYTCRMKLYYSMGKKDEFFAVMKELKESHIVIDQETLEMIRVFS